MEQNSKQTDSEYAISAMCEYLKTELCDVVDYEPYFQRSMLQDLNHNTTPSFISYLKTYVAMFEPKGIPLFIPSPKNDCCNKGTIKIVVV